MEERQMNQQEIAEKYKIDSGTVSLALSQAGLFRKSKGKTYPEFDAADALIRLYRKRAENCQEMANTWRIRARQVETIYELDGNAYPLNTDTEEG